VKVAITLYVSNHFQANVFLSSLPSSYTTVLPVRTPSERPAVPVFETSVVFWLSSTDSLYSLWHNEQEWLRVVASSVDLDELPQGFWLTWSSFNADKVMEYASPVTISALLPLFREHASMIKHALEVLRTATSFLNPGQTPIVTFDQPLYALAKGIQWNWPLSFGEKQFVVRMGGLHIEMAALKALGTFLKGSGWIEALTAASITTPGTAESFLTAGHVKRSRHAHEVTAATLHILQQRAYQAYKSLCGEDISFDEWCKKESSLKPHFRFWFLVKVKNDVCLN